MQYTNEHLYDLLRKHVGKRSELKDTAALLCLKNKKRTLFWMDVISRTTNSGDIGVDLGSGPFTLSLPFINAGGAKIYAVENNEEILNIAKPLIKLLGYQDRIIPVLGDARTYKPPESIDMVIAELVDTGLIAEHLVESMTNIKQTSKENAKYLPCKVNSYAELISKDVSISDKILYDSIQFPILKKRTHVDTIVSFPIYIPSNKSIFINITSEVFFPDGSHVNEFGKSFCPPYFRILTFIRERFYDEIPVELYEGDVVKLGIKYKYGLNRPSIQELDIKRYGESSQSFNLLSFIKRMHN